MYRVLAFGAIFLWGCSPEQGFKSTGDGGGEPSPDIEVNPAFLQFSTLSSGEQDTKTFKVKNVGQDILTVADIFIESAGASPYSILTTPANFEIAPGDARDIQVAFTPLQVANVATAVVQSDDPDEPEAYVDLNGGGAVPELVINPNPAKMGDQFLPCTKTETLEITNIGPEPLTIDAMSYKGQMMTLTNNNSLPVTLMTDDVITVDVDFTPLTVGRFDGTLSVVSNDPRGIVNGLQSGTGVHAGYGTDRYDVVANPPVDILFAVDQSCSMSGPAQALGTAFGTFINTIDSVTNDWQIGVVTDEPGLNPYSSTDGACFNHGVLTRNTSSYTTKFQEAVDWGYDSSGYDTRSEQLFSLVDAALARTGSSGCNRNFLRNDALLHIIFVSDEAEQSASNWSYYRTRYAGVAGVNGNYKVSGIVDKTGCGLGDSGYDTAVADAQVGGEHLDICSSNWGNKAQDLAFASLSGAGSYGLNDPADPDSITVLVNGTPTNNWTYDPNTNSVIVTDNLDDGDKVTIDYGVYSQCN